MSKANRGRPKGREKVRFQVMLYAEQKEKLEYLSQHLTGSPPMSGLLREAVEDFLDRKFSEEVADAFHEEQKKDLRIV